MAESPRIEELKRRVQLDPASIAFAALAEEYRRAGRFEEAIAACISGLQRHPSYLSAHVTLGRSLLEVGRYEESQEELEHVLKLAPENLAAIRGLAEIHHRRGDDGHESYTAAIDTARREAAAPEPAGDARLKPDATEAMAHEVSDPADFGLKVDASEPADLGLKVDATRPADVGLKLEAALAGDGQALAGLEAFLFAILRARAERSAAR